MIISSVASANVRATMLELEQALSFGNIVITDNSAAHSITVYQNGRVDYGSAFRVIRPGVPGILLLSGFRPNTQVYISSTIISAQSATNIGVQTEQFHLSSVTTEPKVILDRNGMGEIRIGGTLTTSGVKGGNYVDTRYQSQFSITIDY